MPVIAVRTAPTNFWPFCNALNAARRHVLGLTTGIGVMRVCFFGSSLVSCYWNGAATYYRGLLRALAARGHVVTFYEPDAFDRQRHRDIPDPDWAEVVVYPATPDGWMPALEQAAQQADLLVKASGIGIFDDELEAAVPDAARPGTIVAYWDVDAPATLDGMSSNPDHPLRRTVFVMMSSLPMAAVSRS